MLLFARALNGKLRRWHYNNRGRVEEPAGSALVPSTSQGLVRANRVGLLRRKPDLRHSIELLQADCGLLSSRRAQSREIDRL